MFVHGLSPLGKERLKPHQFSNFVGLPIDTAVTVGSMVFGGLFERLPGLKVCFSHGGGRSRVCWAAWTTAIVSAWPLGATIRLPSQYLADIWCDSLLRGTASRPRGRRPR